jgi:hypothetical protein
MEVLIMIAIINIPFRATIEPNIFVGEDEVNTFDITHELIPGTQLFRVNIKHINKYDYIKTNIPDLSLTMNYEDLKKLYNMPQETLTGIYNHYIDSIDNYVDEIEKKQDVCGPEEEK